EDGIRDFHVTGVQTCALPIYHTCWARTLLAVLVGALEVPGGTLGTAVKLVRPAFSRTGSCIPGPDGFMRYEFNATSRQEWMAKRSEERRVGKECRSRRVRRS